MGLVHSTIDLSVDASTAFRIATSVDAFPAFMPDVKSVRVLERRDDGYARVEWVGHVSLGSIDRDIKWVEDEWWDAETLKCKFKLVEGDYKKYSGTWDISPTDRGSRIILTVDFDLGLPLIGPLINKLLDKIMKDNLDGMLKAIKIQAEAARKNI